MRELGSSEDRRALLPGGDDRTFLALYYRSSEPGSMAARESAAWDPPAGFEAVAIDLDRHPELSDRFQLTAVRRSPPCSSP